MAYADYMPTIGPSILRRTNGAALSRTTGAALDDQRNRLLQGVLARFPLKGNVDANGAYGPPPSDALDQQLSDRGLRRGPAETDASAGARVQSAWDDYVFAAAHWGVLRQLQIAGYATMNAVQDNGRYSHLTGSSGNIATDLAFGTLGDCEDRTGEVAGWMFDTRAGAYWSQWGLVFTTDAANLQTVGGQAILNSIVAAWGPGTAIYRGAWVMVTGASLLGFPTGRTLGSGHILGGYSHRFIPPDGSAASVIGP
jgi:hypothetical protein